MKAPSKNVSASLRGQSPAGRSPEAVSVTEQRSGGPTMIVPGDGKVEAPPGRGNEQAGMAERSAQKHVEPMKRYGGG